MTMGYKNSSPDMTSVSIYLTTRYKCSLRMSFQIECNKFFPTTAVFLILKCKLRFGRPHIFYFIINILIKFYHGFLGSIQAKGGVVPFFICGNPPDLAPYHPLFILIYKMYYYVPIRIKGFLFLEPIM